MYDAPVGHNLELAAQLDAAVFVESLGRADVVLACIKEVFGVTQLDMCRSPRIPIELKIIGTWWGIERINKAYQESGKKRLPKTWITLERVADRPTHSL